MGRLMRLQVESLVDRAASEITFGWRRIFGALDQAMPTTDSTFPVSDEFVLADAFTLADYMTFERQNADSIWSSFHSARENARQIRHCLTEEFWGCLNLAWLRVRDCDISEIWASSPSRFYRDLVADMYTVSGAASSTMYRDQGWIFLELGRWLEQVQQLSATILAHEAAISSERDVTDADWFSLLRLAQADEIYEESFGLSIDPMLVYRMLVTDRRLPGSLAKSAARFQEKVLDAGNGPDEDAVLALQQGAAEVRSKVEQEWSSHASRVEGMRSIQNQALSLNGLVHSSFFSYLLP